MEGTKIRNITVKINSLIINCCIKYARIRVFLTCLFPYRDTIFDYVLMWEYMGQRKPYSDTLYGVNSLLDEGEFRTACRDIHWVSKLSFKFSKGVGIYFKGK